MEDNKTAGCYYCLEIFPAEEIIGWVDFGKTALCPKCTIDSVVFKAEEDNSDFKQALKDLNLKYF